MLGLTELASSDTASPRRKYERHRAGWPAMCSDIRGFTWESWVLDHSIGGLGLENCPPLEVDQRIEISLLDIGVFICRIAWCTNGRFGVEFLPSESQLNADEVSILAQLVSGP